MSQLSDTVLLEDHISNACVYRRCCTITRSAPARPAREAKAMRAFCWIWPPESDSASGNQLKRRLKEARFPSDENPGRDGLQEVAGSGGAAGRELLQCDYIPRERIWRSSDGHGTGKSHAATVLGVEACRQGYRVLFWTAAELVNTLVEAREERQLQRLLKRFDRFELVIVDDSATSLSPRREPSCCFKSSPIATKHLGPGDIQPGLRRMDEGLW